MLSSDKPYTLDSVVRMVLGAGFAVGLVWLLGYLSSALVPFVAALLLAYLLNPTASAIEKRINNRWVAVSVTVVGLIAALVGVVWVLVPMMASEFAAMGKVFRDIATNQDFAARVREYLPEDVWEWLRNLASDRDVQAFFTSDGAVNMAEGLVDKVMPGIKGFLRGTANVLGGFLTGGIILLYMIFLLADFGKIQANWQGYLPSRYRRPVTEFLDEFEQTMSRYFRSQVIIALLVGGLLSIGFVIIDLPLAVALGMFIGILNIAPYLGTIGIVPAILLGGLGAIEGGSSPWVGMGLALVVVCVVQVIQDGVLVPKIQGESLGLSPWMIILSLSIWGKLLGFLGLLIALPMTCLCLSYYRRLLAKREARGMESA